MAGCSSPGSARAKKDSTVEIKKGNQISGIEKSGWLNEHSVVVKLKIAFIPNQE